MQFPYCLKDHEKNLASTHRVRKINDCLKTFEKESVWWVSRKTEWNFQVLSINFLKVEVKK